MKREVDAYLTCHESFRAFKIQTCEQRFMRSLLLPKSTASFSCPRTRAMCTALRYLFIHLLLTELRDFDLPGIHLISNSIASKTTQSTITGTATRILVSSRHHGGRPWRRPQRKGCHDPPPFCKYIQQQQRQHQRPRAWSQATP